jgi:hypothetical protein
MYASPQSAGNKPNGHPTNVTSLKNMRLALCPPAWGTPLCSIITKPMKPIHAGNEPARTYPVNVNSLWLSSPSITYRRQHERLGCIITKYETGPVPTCVKGTPLCSILTKRMKPIHAGNELARTNPVNVNSLWLWSPSVTYRRQHERLGCITVKYATDPVPTCVKGTPLCSIITKRMKPIHAGNELARTNPVNVNSLWLWSPSVTYRRQHERLGCITVKYATDPVPTCVRDPTL